MSFSKQHLLGIEPLAPAEITEILDLAEQYVSLNRNEMKHADALRGLTQINMFFENSTRTQASFELAGKRLGADVMNMSMQASSIKKGETLIDTALTLNAMHPDLLVVRHPHSGAVDLLAQKVNCAVLNAGDGKHEHPTQALLDAMTLRQHRARLAGVDPTGTDLAGMHVVIVGDVLHSRVVRSNMWLLSTLGARVTLVAPPTLVPVGVQHWPVEVRFDLDEALAEGPDAVMMLRVQRERMHAAFFPSEAEYARTWGLTHERLQLLDAAGLETAIMHPGPMNRGLEISSEAADSPRSTVLRQVANGVSVRMACLYLLLTGEDETAGADPFSPEETR